MMKKLPYILAAALWLSAGAVSADSPQFYPVNVTLNGAPLQSAQPAVLYHDTTLVPVRAVCEAMAYTVDWDGAKQQVTVSKGDEYVSLYINYRDYLTGNTAEDTIDGKYLTAPPVLIHDTTMIPLRAVAENFHCLVDWNGETQTAAVYSLAGMRYEDANAALEGVLGYRNEKSTELKDQKGGIFTLASYKKSDSQIDLMYDAAGTVVYDSVSSEEGERPAKLPLNAFEAYPVALFKRVNAERAAAGIPALVWDQALADCAGTYAREMLEGSFFGSCDPAGISLTDRVLGLQIPCSLAAGHAAMGQSDPEETAARWLEEPEARGDLLNPRLTKFGAQIAAKSYVVYWSVCLTD